MEFSNTMLGMEKLTYQSSYELSFDLENYRLLEINTKDFLIHFFRKDILNSLFIYQIEKFSVQAVYDFQEHIFQNVKEYLNTLLNIDGLAFSYTPQPLPFIINISISGMVLCNLDIFNKKIEILNEFYFKDIFDAVNRLNEEKLVLEKEYDKNNRYSINSMEILKDNQDLNMLKSLDIMMSSVKKNNKYKNQSQQNCEEILNKIYKINMDLEEYLLIENTLRKNMLSINYYQNKISDRISRHLHYTIIYN